MAEQADKASAKKLDTEALQEALSNLPKAVQEAVMKGIKDTVQEDRAMVAAAKARKEEEADDDDGSDDDDDKDFDIERVSRKDLVKFLEGKFTKSLAKALKPLQKQIEEAGSSTERDKLLAAFHKVKADHKDFDQWKDEIKAIAAENPMLSPENMYQLARALDSEKAKKINEEASKKAEAADKSEKTAFGGLMPTSGKGADKNTKMNSKDAGALAWEQTMSSVPKELIGDSS